jgi:hypothetical protein
MKIPNEVYQGIVAYFHQEKEASNTMQIQVQFDGDESKPYYIAWIHRQIEETDPETGRLATLLTWAKFSYIDKKLIFVRGSWEHMVLHQKLSSLPPEKQTPVRELVKINEVTPVNRRSAVA